MRKRCMSILLAFCMAWTLFPAFTFAGTSDGDAVPIIAEADATSPDETSAESAALSDAGDAMTRGAWMREMVNLFGLTLNKDEYPDVYFPDIAESEYFDDIMVATKFGLADVEAGDNFEPDAPLTRDFASHTLNFYLGIQNDRESYTYSDADSVVWRDDAQVAVDNGWLALSDGKFAPASDVTAEETATMLSFATETLNGRKVDESVANYAFSSYVKELPSDAEIKSTLDIDSGVTTLEISEYSGTLAANDTIVFYSDGFAFVYGVASVTESDGVLTVVTKEAPDDAIEQFEQVGETQPELEPYLPEDNEPVSLMAADGEMVTFDRVELLDAGKHKISYKRDFNKNGLSGKLSAEVTDISLKTNFIGDKQYVTLSGKITLSSTMELDFLNDDAAAQLFLGGIYIGKFGTLGLEINLKAAASIAYEYSAKFTVGVESLNGSKSLIHQLSASDTCITAKGTVSAKLALAARLEFGKLAKFYAGIGIGPTLSAKFKQYPSGTPQRCINLSGYLAADMEISAKLGKLKYEYTKDIYSESNSPIRVVEHIEDGITVPSCTRGKDSGTEESGYSTPKYTTPTNSRYYASGISNVSSTGYGGYGSTEPVVIWQTSDNGDDTVTITGYSGNASILNIPETIDGKTVTKIGSNAFQRKTGIRIVKIQDTVISIGGSAFSGCTNLTSVDFGQSLQAIHLWAFYNTAIERIELPEGLTTLGVRAFGNCNSATYAYIPSTVTTFESSYDDYGRGVFGDCESLDEIEFGEGIPMIANRLFAYCTGLTHIEIPDTVTKIGSNAFAGCPNLISATISDNVTEIDGYAFYNCTNLKTVRFGNSLQAIHLWAFYNTAIERIELPEGLTTLGVRAFGNCNSATYAYIPSTVTTFESSYDDYGRGVFGDCESLDEIEFGEGIPMIANRLFAYCTGLTHIEIPNAVTKIGSNAFAGCPNLISTTISDSVTEIDGYAFYNCTNLKTVKFGNSLQAIHLWAFYNTAIERIELPEGLTTLGVRAFGNCNSATYAYIPSTVTTFESSYDDYGRGVFGDCESLDEIEFGEGIPMIANRLFAYCTGLTHIEIPDTVTKIGSNAFAGCPNLISAIISDNVTEIDGYAFYNCTNLKTVKFGNSLQAIHLWAFYNTAIERIELPEGLTTLGVRAFGNCNSATYAYIPSTVTTFESSYDDYGRGVFGDCESLDEIEFGEGIPMIANRLFAYCTGLTHIEIPDTVTEIGNSAFAYCSKLESINIPDSLTSIGASAFYNSGLTSIIIPDGITTYADSILRNCTKLVSVTLSKNSLKIPAGMFSGCSSLKSIGMPDGVTEIKNEAFKSCINLTDLAWMPNSVVSIGNNAFENCAGLTNAILPDLVSSLGGATFKGCTSLTSFKGGANLKTVGANCFQDCAALTDVHFANGLTSIGNYAFQNCAALETIVLPDSVTSIGTYAFQKDAALKDVTLSSGLTQIPSYAFANCTSMTELEIPSGVTTIKGHAFYQDTKLKTFVIPASVGKIEDNAFSYPTTTTVYGVPGSYAETYAKWAAFLDIAQYRKTGTMGDAQELQWTYDPGGKTVTVTGAVNASDPVYVGSYDANGKMLSVKLITTSNGAAQADDGANTVMLFWLDSNFMPKCGKATIRNA